MDCALEERFLEKQRVKPAFNSLSSAFSAMSQNTKQMRTNGARPSTEKSKRGPPQPEKTQRAKSSLLEREEEYKRLNAELEAKTAQLVREAEAIMTEQENFLLRSSPERPETSDDLFSRDSDDEMRGSPESRDVEPLSFGQKFGLLDLVDKDEYDTGEGQKSSTARVTARSTKSSSSINRKPASARTVNRRPNSTVDAKKSRKTVSAKAAHRKPASAADDVAIPDDFLSKFTLDGAISNIENNLPEKFSARGTEEDDIMPAAAAEMGSEAQIRFLKAKLRVMQEELERLSQECRSGAEERKKLNLTLKDASEEQGRLQKTNNAQQTQIEKHKRLLEEEKKKAESVGVQVQNLRKELEALKREQKQSSVTHNATEVRLNRALEEVERYKTQLQKDKHTNKESSDQDRKEMDRLRGDNKRLERLKADMSTVFKKQQKLISILKRQILHVEAAKLLSFTEEEFVKALDWGSK